MKRTILSAALSLLCVASFACTNLIVGKKASVDGSVICTYNCDGFGFASPLSYSPAGRHAPGEMIALRSAYETLGSLDGCTLYVTLEPCAMCTGAMMHLRLPRLVYGAFDPDCGCCGSRIDLSDHWFDHSVETIGGICEPACAALLKEFFRSVRNK